MRKAQYTCTAVYQSSTNQVSTSRSSSWTIVQTPICYNINFLPIYRAKDNMYPTHASALHMHVPFTFMCPTHSCALLHLVVLYTWMCPKHACALHIHLPYICMCPTHACALHICVPYTFMCSTLACTKTLTCAQQMLVSNTCLCPSLACALHLLAPFIRLCSSLACALHLLVPLTCLYWRRRWQQLDIFSTWGIVDFKIQHFYYTM